MIISDDLEDLRGRECHVVVEGNLKIENYSRN